MSDLFLTSPFDILFKDFFNTNSPFTPATEAKYSHPVDIYEDDNGLHIEVACTGLDKDDIDIIIESCWYVRHPLRQQTKPVTVLLLRPYLQPKSLMPAWRP
jgi:HSP20 family molecular chaperone IbpA